MESANLHQKVTCELVLQNGRQAGTRQSLCTPTTFIGREPGCEIRLNVEGIDPLHCLLIAGPEGVRLRDLNSASGTFVNGVRTGHLDLQNGDLLSVGPFQFRVELAAEPATETDAQRDALRIQAAAIAAQQAALDDEEARLQKRKTDLEQQEEQLAAHLAEKQRQIEISGAESQAERESLCAAKTEHEAHVARVEAELAKARDAIAKDHQNVTLERQRVNKIYHRLRQRWQKHWTGENEKYRRLAEQLEADRKQLEQSQAAWREREAALAQEILRFNTERELTTRQMQDERATLKSDQEAWRKRRSLEMAALDVRQCDIDDALARLAQARQLMAQEKDAWDRQLETLHKELHSLNNRILHQRICIQGQEDEIARLDATRRERRAAESDARTDAPMAAVVECDVEILGDDSMPSSVAPRIINLEQLAGDLTDQRIALAEQYERLVQFNRTWHEERTRAADDLDALAERLVATEEDILARQADTQAGEQALRERHAEIEAVRQEIAIHRAQMNTRAQALEAEHAREMMALRQKEALLEEQLAALAQVRQRWNARRQDEMTELQASRAALAREQAEAHAQRGELFVTAQQLAVEKRVLAEKSLALEQYRQEVFLRAKDPVAQRRVERLRRRWLTLQAAMVRHARNEREAAVDDLKRIEEGRAELQDQLGRLTQAEAVLAENQSLLDERDAVLKARQIYLDDELRKLEHLKLAPERQRLLLREDVESVAQVVFEEINSPPIDKAA